MKVCKNFKDRLLGLMFQRKFKEEYLFPNCKSIHTFFMRFNIDIIAINNDNKIIKIYKDISPNKIIFMPKDTHAVLETKTNSSYKLNDTIKY